MVIDDNPIDRYVAEKAARLFLYSDEVLVMETAKKALQYLQDCEYETSKLPQLIFLDIRMPEMDGFEFLDRYLELPDSVRKNCIIVMLTSSTHPEDRKKAEQNPYVFDYFIKPLTAAKLKELIT